MIRWSVTFHTKKKAVCNLLLKCGKAWRRKVLKTEVWQTSNKESSVHLLISIKEFHLDVVLSRPKPIYVFGNIIMIIVSLLNHQLYSLLFLYLHHHLHLTCNAAAFCARSLMFFYFCHFTLQATSAAASNGTPQIVMAGAELANKIKDGLPTQVVQVPALGNITAIDWATKLKVPVSSVTLIKTLS